ncbi:MAG: RNA polymerase sigma factor [Verrucomicrobia bacterium]|nr:RNA polymerase sigma factor [Verrucomicrobiota bacterium]
MTDSSQFEAFMRAYQNMVYSIAMRLLGNAADAEDIAQEVFLRAYDRFAGLRDSPGAGGWLRTVARNLCLNHLARYRGRWRFFSEMGPEDENGNRGPELAAPETDAGGGSGEDEREILEAALQRLPAGQRVALVLYHFEELSYDDIAARLKVSLSKVKTDIHRARLALRRSLRTRAADLGAVPGPLPSPAKTLHPHDPP